MKLLDHRARSATSNPRVERGVREVGGDDAREGDGPGQCEAQREQVAGLLERLWGGSETLIVISSDLSHYHDYATARRLDQSTCESIESLDPSGIHSSEACGCIPVGGLLQVARQRNMTVETVDLRNSGDTAGPRDRVVGYGAWLFYAG